MTAPGVGALVSLAFKTAVDDPRWFSRSRDVGAHFGLTPREYSSGEVSYHGRISKMGDREVRRLLYVAASRILRRDTALWCPLKVWAVRLAQRVGIRRAWVALARKLVVVLHAIFEHDMMHCLLELEPREPSAMQLGPCRSPVMTALAQQEAR